MKHNSVVINKTKHTSESRKNTNKSTVHYSYFFRVRVCVRLWVSEQSAISYLYIASISVTYFSNNKHCTLFCIV